MTTTITIPVALTEAIAEDLDARTVLNAVNTRQEAVSAFWQSTKLAHGLSPLSGGFAWEVISHAVSESNNPSWEQVKEKALAVLDGKVTPRNAGEFAASLEFTDSDETFVSHLAVAFMVWATFGEMGRVNVLRFNNNRQRGWVIRPTFKNVMEARRDMAVNGKVMPAVSIVTDKSDITEIRGFERFHEATFDSVMRGEGVLIERFDDSVSVEAFVDALSRVALGFKVGRHEFVGVE